MARKTIHIEDLVDEANSMLLNSPDGEKEARRGIAGFLEAMLHRNGCYAGYGFLNQHQMAYSHSGKTPGIIVAPLGSGESSTLVDDTRRQYGLKGGCRK